MSYAINIAGHVVAPEGGDAAELEAQVIESAKAFTAELEGLTNASGSFEHHGFVDLKPAAADTTAEAATPAEGTTTPPAEGTTEQPAEGTTTPPAEGTTPPAEPQS